MRKYGKERINIKKQCICIAQKEKKEKEKEKDIKKEWEIFFLFEDEYGVKRRKKNQRKRRYNLTYTSSG